MAKRGVNNIEVDGELKPGDGIAGYEYGADLKTEGVPLIDPGSGPTVSLRTFAFKMNPEVIKHFPKNKQDIFNAHAGQIKTILWGDGLVPYEDSSPRVIISMKKRMYYILVPCVARLNVSWLESPKNLSEELMKEKANGKLEKPTPH